MELKLKADDTIMEVVKAIIDDWKDEERLDLFSQYCIRCGSKRTSCQCWNDE